MPDITMCLGGDNVKCNNCYRKLAKPSEYQYYFMQIPMLADGTCDEAIQINSEYLRNVNK